MWVFFLYVSCFMFYHVLCLTSADRPKCEQFSAKKGLTCLMCRKNFKHPVNRKNHEKTCKSVGAYEYQDPNIQKCDKCNHHFFIKVMKDRHVCHTDNMDVAMDSKSKPSGISMEKVARRFHCHSCNYDCDDRRTLCFHQNYQHGVLHSAIPGERVKHLGMQEIRH